MAENVYEYYAETLNRKPFRAERTDGLKECTMDTYCGQECKKIIDTARVLLDMCDTHPHVVDNIHRGVTAAVETICFG